MVGLRVSHVFSRFFFYTCDTSDTWRLFLASDLYDACSSYLCLTDCTDGTDFFSPAAIFSHTDFTDFTDSFYTCDTIGRLHVSHGFTRIFFSLSLRVGLRVSHVFSRIYFYTCDTSDTWRLFLELPPDHLVDYSDIRLDDTHDFGGDILVNIIWHRDARVAVTD